MTDQKRLIEVDFPLEQVSIDSVHEKNVRSGHISSLHVWPARRPLAACRAALIATLLPDPGNAEERQEIFQRLAGEVIETIEKKKIGNRTVEKRKRKSRGGILHWGQETNADLDWFREKIRAAYGGRAPKVLDPFAGGGAIPLEAMRLGCDVTAIDINPVAWFILKCTLEYPQKLAGRTLSLPDFVLRDRQFMESFLSAKGLKGLTLKHHLAKLGLDKSGKEAEPELIDHDLGIEADLAWQVRAWGRWVLAEARKQLSFRYPTYAEFQALKPGGRPYDTQPLRLLDPDAEGNTDVAGLNGRFDKAYLEDPRNPRWLARPTVAYHWARIVRCKGCRATIPLVKTRWLAKKPNKRILLTMTPKPDKSGVSFDVLKDVPQFGGNAAQRREHDKRIGAGTMSRSGAQCPCCPTIMTSEDIRLEGLADRLGAQLVCVVIDGEKGKDYRLPTDFETVQTQVSSSELAEIFADIEFGDLSEPISSNRPSPNTRGASGLPRFGVTSWDKVFTNRQRYSLAAILKIIRAAHDKILLTSDREWSDAIFSYLCCAFDRMLDFNSQLCTWILSVEAVRNTFVRYVLPLSNDFCEVALVNDVRGGFGMCVDKIGRSIETISKACRPGDAVPIVQLASAKSVTLNEQFDVICTDPPYYDAIPYSDIMDYFHVWLRRLVASKKTISQGAFNKTSGPKWDHATSDGELIDDVSRFEGDQTRSRTSYEGGMASVFENCRAALKDDGRFVVVFANKQPAAWETLVSALVRSGFVVDGSWPIQTEQAARMQAISGAALASSVWLVCKKRPPGRPGWDNAVLAEMRDRIHSQLRTYWDAGIRGPDFVWAATGPALEAFSKYPLVKKADEPNAQMTVSEFLRDVRRLVVDFVVGRVLSHGAGMETPVSLDDITTYYLLHRNDFGLEEAPIGACILYALSCNLSDSELADRFDILSRTGGTLFEEDEPTEVHDDENAEDVDESIEGKGNKVKLKPWNQRRGKALGYEALAGRPIPLIDQVHRLMHLWRAGEESKVDDYLDTRGLKRNALFAQLLQALIELSPPASEERSILESLSNHIVSRGGIAAPRQIGMEV